MCEPLSLGAIFASVGSAFKFADLAIRVAEVGSENEVFVRTIRVVRDDLNEVERLLNVESVQRKLTSIPGKLPWIKGAIFNTKSALNEIGKWVEHARVEQESTGSIRFETRVRWVFNDHEKLLNRKTELMTCHQQLSNVLSYLIRLEDIPATSEPPEYIDTTFFDDVLSRHKRRTVAIVPGDSHHRPETPPGPNATTKSKVMSRNSKPLGPPTLFAGDVSQNKTITIPTKLDTWPETPPCSPPPTYTLIVEPNMQYGKPRHEKANSVTLRPSGYDIARDCKSGALVSKDNNTSVERRGTWAHEYVHKNALVPELAGDTIFMSGTNSLGPVNPFDFYPGPCSQDGTTTAKCDESAALVEVLGSLNFAVELPANDPGPPPGYPPRSRQIPSSKLAEIWSAKNKDSYSQAVPASELPTVSRRRPVATHARTDLGTKPHSLASKSGTHAPSMNSAQTTFVAHSLGTVHDRSELPSSSRQPPVSRHTFSTHSYHESELQNIAPASLVNVSPPVHIPSPIFHDTTHANYGVHKRDETTHAGKQVTQLQPQEPTALARMRRQKDIMNMLGSLDS